MTKNYLYAIATLVGTIVGAGIFALPFVISQSGIAALFIYLPILVLIQYYLHKMYAEVVLSTKSEHRLPGYMEIYAGKKYKNITAFFCIIGAYGSLLAYIILGGIFLHSLLSGIFGGTPFIYSIILFAFESSIVFFGLKTVAGTEFFMSIFLTAVILAITLKSFNFINPLNFNLVDWKYFLLPYGPIFFSIGGGTAIPDLCNILKNEKKRIKSAIFWGTLIPAVITLVFVMVVVGAVGTKITPDTLTGLQSVFHDGIVFFSLIFGILSVITSFLIITQATKEIYLWDFKINKNISWFLASSVPFILFLLGMQNFTAIVGFTGAITGGVLGIVLIYLILKTQKKAQKKSPIRTNVSKPVAIILSLLFILGLIYELFNFFDFKICL